MKPFEFFCCAALTVTLSVASAAAPLNHRTQKEIAAATQVNRNISEMAAAVGKCAATAPPSGCACRFPLQLKQLQSSYSSAIRQFPAWRGNTVTWQEASTGQTVVIAFGGLEQQLRARCP